VVIGSSSSAPDFGRPGDRDAALATGPGRVCEVTVIDKGRGSSSASPCWTCLFGGWPAIDQVRIPNCGYARMSGCADGAGDDHRRRSRERRVTTGAACRGDRDRDRAPARLRPGRNPASPRAATNSRSPALSARPRRWRVSPGSRMIGGRSAGAVQVPAGAERVRRCLLDRRDCGQGAFATSAGFVVIPFGTPVPPSPETSAALGSRVRGRGTELISAPVASLDPGGGSPSSTRPGARIRPIPRFPSHRAPDP